jgi:translation initiation factor 4G
MRRTSTPVNSEAETDVVFTRKVKGLLNKLTIEKFPQLSRQIMECPFQCVDHVNILIEEIFEKATTQHNYIDMYTGLCELLHDFFSENPVSRDPKCGFKRLLLNECQRCFERNLEPPTNLHKLTFEERCVAEASYKTRMLGNIKFVGALLSRHMLASKVLIAILQDLMSDPIPEALETVAALLTVTGPVFDKSEWPHFKQLEAIFTTIESICGQTNKAQTVGARVRCLLQDVLDLRARDWEDCRPKRMEAPTTLQAVAEKAKEELPEERPRYNTRTNSNAYYR